MDEAEAMLPEPTDLKSKIELTGQAQIERMRETVAPPGKKGTWLRKLNNRQLAEVYHRLKLGQPAYKITKLAQEGWGINPKSDIKSLARAMREFKDKMLGELDLARTHHSQQQKQEARQLSQRGKNIVKQLDGMGRLRWLIECQTERVELLLEREKKALPFKFTDDSMKSLKDMIDSYLNFQIRLGLLDSKPPELHLKVKHRFDGLMANAIGGGTAVVDAADRWLEQCERHALTLRLGDNGAYQIEAADGDTECTEDDTAGQSSAAGGRAETGDGGREGDELQADPEGGSDAGTVGAQLQNRRD